MEILQLISEQTPAVALAITIWWFSNRDILRLLQERREMIEALRIERKEWVEAIRLVTIQYEERIHASTESRMAQSAELHTLKNKIQELILKVEAVLMWTDKRAGTGGSDD